jgi:hypothetical protein
MKRFIAIAMLTLVGLASAAPGQAAVIHESATLGPTGIQSNVPGITLFQHLGSRFTVDEAIEVESVGGHFVGFSIWFAAIVSLASPTALPSGSPYDATTVAATVFSPPFPSDDVLIPLSATLSPGSYALIIGAGYFGAGMASGGMPANNVDIPGSASYISWYLDDSLGWREAAPQGLRFVVTGRVVPEPGAIAIFGFGVLGLAGRFRRQWNKRR